MTAPSSVAVTSRSGGTAASFEELSRRQTRVHEKFQNLERRMTLLERAFDSPVWGGAVCRHVPHVLRLGTILYCCWHAEPAATTNHATAGSPAATATATASADSGAIIHRRIPNSCPIKAAARAGADGDGSDDESGAGGGSGAGSALGGNNELGRVYALNKRLVMSAVATVERLTTENSGGRFGVVPLPPLPHELAALAPAPPPPAPPAPAPVPNSDSKHDERLHYWRVVVLQRFLIRLCLVPISYEQSVQALVDAPALSALCKSVDANSRSVIGNQMYDRLPAGARPLASDSPANRNTRRSLLFTESVDEYYRKANRTNWMESKAGPFDHFKFTFPFASLAACEKRMPCPVCNRNVSFYCADCLRWACDDVLKLPPVRLPVLFDILHHPQENIRKSTSIHAAVLAPAAIRICHLPTHTEKKQSKQLETTTASAPAANGVSASDATATAASGKRPIVHPVSTAKQNRQPKIRKSKLAAADAAAASSAAAPAAASASPASATPTAAPDSADSKSRSAAAAAAPSPPAVEVLFEMPAYGTAHDTLLLYPSAQAVYLDDPSLASELRSGSIRRIIVVESTWQKGSVVCHHPNLSAVRHIKLRERVSTFWRYQELGNTFLSTLEAMYFVCVDFVNAKAKAASSTGGDTKSDAATAIATAAATTAASDYAGECDDLMLIYAYMHSRIKRLAESGGGSSESGDSESVADSKSAPAKPNRYPKSWRITPHPAQK